MGTCNFEWTTGDGTLGTNHSCNGERDHYAAIHTCHCGTCSVERVAMVEVAEQLHTALGEFITGLKTLPTLTNADELASMKAELQASARELNAHAFNYFASILAHGVG